MGGISLGTEPATDGHTLAGAVTKECVVEIGGGSQVRGGSPRFLEVGGDSSKFAKVRRGSGKLGSGNSVWKLAEVRGRFACGEYQ